MHVACQSGDAWADYQRPVPAEESVDGVGDLWGEPLNGNFGQLLKLKAKHPDLKVMLSLGGWTWSKYFSDAALTAESREAFVASCVDLFIKGNLPSLGGGESGGPGSAAGVFDGIDLDWEWPGCEGNAGNVIRPEDKAELHRCWSPSSAGSSTRTGARPASTTSSPRSCRPHPAKIDAGFEVPKIFKYLDFATVQGYDFHGTWETVTNQQSALRVAGRRADHPDFSLDCAVKAWLAAGRPRDQLVIGIPYYGQGWTGVTGGGDGLFQPATGPAPGTWAAGNEDYKVLATKPGRRSHDLLDGANVAVRRHALLDLRRPADHRQKTVYVRLHRPRRRHGLVPGR